MTAPSALEPSNVPSASAGTETMGGAKPSASSLGRLLGRRTIVWLIVAVVAALALATVELGISLFLQLFLKSLGLLSTDVKTPLVHFDLTPGMLAAGLTVIAMIRSLSQFLVGQSATVAMETINARIRRLAIWDMLLHPSQRVVPAAAVNARVGDLAVKSSLFCFAGAALIGSLVQAIALAVAMSFTAIGETAIALAGLVLIGLLVLRVNKTTRKVTSNVPAELRVLTEGIERVARNMSLVRVLRTQALEQRRLATAVDRYASYLVHAGYLGNFAMAVTPFAGVLLILLIVGWSQSVLHTPGIILLSFLYLFVRFVQALATATSQFSNCSATWPMFKDSLEYVSSFGRDDMNSAMRVGDALIGRAIERVRSRGGEPPEIAVRGVAFAYPGTDVEVLRDVSAEISKGAQFAIVGPSGAGKSTLLGIILGLFEPSRGSVRIDGRSPAAYFNDSRVRVGYVGAEAFLIAGSIRENLRYGISREADDDDLFDALAQARLREAVEGLQGRLDYVIGEDGSGLSAGQKQRLCLARALLNRPHVLVLDEASANLDAETESEIAESLRNLHGTCTMIVVSHRKGLLKYADRTVTLGQSE